MSIRRQVIDVTCAACALDSADDGQVSGAALNSDAALPRCVMLPFAGSALPSGFLWCNGQPVSRTSYAALFAAIGTAFGAGDGASTFNLPDLRDRVPIGQGTMGGVSAAGRVTNAGTGNPSLDTNVIGNAGGVDRHTLSAAQMPAHTHTVTAPQNFDELAGTLGSAVVTRISTSRTTSSAGGGEAHPNLQPSLVATYVIKT